MDLAGQSQVGHLGIGFVRRDQELHPMLFEGLGRKVGGQRAGGPIQNAYDEEEDGQSQQEGSAHLYDLLGHGASDCDGALKALFCRGNVACGQVRHGLHLVLIP